MLNVIAHSSTSGVGLEMGQWLGRQQNTAGAQEGMLLVLSSCGAWGLKWGWPGSLAHNPSSPVGRIPPQWEGIHRSLGCRYWLAKNCLVFSYYGIENPNELFDQPSEMTVIWHRWWILIALRKWLLSWSIRESLWVKVQFSCVWRVWRTWLAMLGQEWSSIIAAKPVTGRVSFGVNSGAAFVHITKS